jgi:DNA-binding NarL/FixJ family response regulator
VSTTSIRIVHLASDADAKAAVRDVLTSCRDLAVTDEVTDAAGILATLSSDSADVVLLDLGCHGLDPTGLTREIRQHHPKVRVLVFTSCDSPHDIFATLDAGADGYVLKSNLAEGLENAIRSVRLGTVWLDPGIAKQVLDIIAEAPLIGSPRELPTGVMIMPLFPHERNLLSEVAASSCVDGVCQVDPSFIRKLRRFASAAAST